MKLSRGGRPGFPVPNSRYGLCYGLCGREATLNWNWYYQSSGAASVKVEVAILAGSPSLTSLMVSVDVDNIESKMRVGQCYDMFESVCGSVSRL